MCFAVRSDLEGEQTPTELDDLSAGCRDAGDNAEFVIVRTTPRADGLCYVGTCDASADPARDCPFR